MADKIHEEERRLIDEAIAEGRVTQIPKGTTSYEYVYNKAKHRLENKVKSSWNKNGVSQNLVNYRKNRIVELRAEGKTLKEIAEDLNLSRAYIIIYVRKLKNEGRLPP